MKPDFSAYIWYSELNRLVQTSKFRVLDLGCGMGVFLDFFTCRYYLGVDMNRKVITKGKLYHPQNDFVIADLADWPLKQYGGFDLVLLIGTLPYVQDELALLKDVYDSLAGGGSCIVSATTDYPLYKILDIYGWLRPHRWFNRKMLVQELISIGYTIDESSEKGLILTPLLNIVYLPFDFLDRLAFKARGQSFLGVRVRKILGHIALWELRLPINFGYQLVIKCTKPVGSYKE